MCEKKARVKSLDLRSLYQCENIVKLCELIAGCFRLGYHLDSHLDEFEQFVKIDKDSKILDVAAGTGMVGQKVWGYFCLISLTKSSQNPFLSISAAACGNY